MSFVTDTWRQLVRRRLWPVALLLLAALAAVPFLLAKDPEPAAVTAAPTGAGKTTLAEDTADPIVSVANADEARRRRVLGAAKDPFEPAPAKKVKKAKATGAGSATPTPTETATPESSGGSSGGSTSPEVPGTTVPVPAATPTPAPKKTYPLYTLTVRFGDSSADLPRRKVTRLEALPDAETPALVYLGVKDGGKAAVFMLDSTVTAQGDGTCEPSTATCETLVLREGETEFFDVVDEEGNSTAQFELDLIDINTKKASSSRKLSSASKAGAAAVKAHAAVGGSLRYRYNARKGTLKRLGLKASKTAAANAEAAVVGGS